MSRKARGGTMAEGRYPRAAHGRAQAADPRRGPGHGRGRRVGGGHVAAPGRRDRVHPARLYGHFPGGKTEIMRTVALAGFAELAAATQAAMGAGQARGRSRRSRARTWASPRRIRRSTRRCSSCRSMRASRKTTRRPNCVPASTRWAPHSAMTTRTATELLWSALHGMSLLERAGRMRQEHRPNRIAELAARFAS